MFDLKADHQIWLMSSPLPFPVNLLAVHCWLVVSATSGGLERWEVWQKPNLCKNSWGHVHLNLFPPDQGIIKLPIPFSLKNCWPVTIAGYCEGNAGEKIITFLKSQAPDYPCKDNYHYLGPNSNSFIQWVLHNTSVSELILPPKALGKYLFKNSKR